MQYQYTPNPLLEPLRRRLTKPQWQNLVALIVAVQLGRTLVLRRLALFLLTGISTASCYRRLERILAWEQERTWQPLRRLWVRAVLRCFAPGRSRLPLLIDWTWHRDRCRSLWVMLPVGGRAVPLCFWLAPCDSGGTGTQRALEDQALRDLHAWLPRSRPVVLIGDRGFRGRDRMRLLAQLGWHFVLRVSGQTQVEWEGRWVALAALRPEVGGRWQRAGLRLGKPGVGKGKAGHSVTVNLVAVRQALAAPKPVRTNKGHPTGATAEDTTWFLATDLPLTTDVVTLYAWRMQIEQTFRDFKSLFGLEQEGTAQPWVRLEALLFAVMVGWTLAVQAADPQPRVLRRVPRVSPQEHAVPPPVPAQYRSESVTREGLHQCVVQLLLGQSPLTPELQALAHKSQRLQARPQVQDRRRRTPALRRRTRPPTCKTQA